MVMGSHGGTGVNIGGGGGGSSLADRIRSVTGRESGAKSSSFGGATRASLKKNSVKAAIQTQETQVNNDLLTLLLSSQTGYGGYSLKNLKSLAGTGSGTAVLVEVANQDGTTYYIPAYPSYT